MGGGGGRPKNLDVGGQQFARRYPGVATTTDVADTVFSAALERRLSTREALRASYDEAYLPNTGQDRNGQFVAPRRSSQRELSTAGVRRAARLYVTRLFVPSRRIRQ